MKLVKTSLLLYIQFLTIDPFTWFLHMGVGLGDMEKNLMMYIFFILVDITKYHDIIYITRK